MSSSYQYTRYRRNQYSHFPRSARRKTRSILRLAGGLLVLFVLINVVVLAAYNKRTYPRTKIMGAVIGSVGFGSLDSYVRKQAPLPEDLTLKHQDTSVKVPLAELGIRLDSAPAVASAKTQRHWLPIANLFAAPALAAPVSIDPETLSAKARELDKTFSGQPQDAHLSLADGNVHINGGQPGYTLDHGNLAAALTSSLTAGEASVSVPVKPIAPKVQASDLERDKRQLEAQLATLIQFRYNSKTIQPSRTDRTNWYAPSGQSFSPDIGNIIAYITQVGTDLGIRIAGGSAVAEEIAKALVANQPLDKKLTAAHTAKTFSYCTATKGVSNGELPTLRHKLTQTYADPRGWSLDGRIAFRHVEQGCDFTVWLTAANLMPTFGEICDSMWSCRIGPNVVINYDRWQHASPAWNEYGGSLEDYRYMVINHETGHWLGFGHYMCPGSGQLAPVMQQQSISLQGCAFNPWPTSTELQVYRQKLEL